jgi:hypothetical protein
MVAEAPQLGFELAQHIQARTGRRIRHLSVDVEPGRIVLRGQTASFYLKQLAQHGVRELLPQVKLENAIVVDSN